jgi:hypothetical protein
VQTQEIYEEGQAGTARREHQDGNFLMPFKVGLISQIIRIFLKIIIGYVRLYSFGYHDTTTAVFNTSPSSEAVSTTTLRLPQLTYEFLIFLSIF